MITKEVRKEILADYFQFYLQDEKADEDFSEKWTPEAMERLLALGTKTIGIGTVRDTKVPVAVKVFDCDPGMVSNVQVMDQINECDIEVVSSCLVLYGCLEDPDTAVRIDLASGRYRVRLYYGALHTLSANRRTGGDFYEIHLWPSQENKGLNIMRQKTA